MEQPMGYVSKGHENKVVILKKALYELKQAQEHEIVELKNIFKIVILLNTLMNMMSI